jgi:hypothetical protein
MVRERTVTSQIAIERNATGRRGADPTRIPRPIHLSRTVERTATQPVGVAGVCSVIGWPALEAWSLIEETVLSSP